MDLSSPIMAAVALSEPGTTLCGTPRVKASLWFSSASSLRQILNSPMEPQPVEKPIWSTWLVSGPANCRIRVSLDGSRPCPTYHRKWKQSCLVVNLFLWGRFWVLGVMGDQLHRIQTEKHWCFVFVCAACENQSLFPRFLFFRSTLLKWWTDLCMALWRNVCAHPEEPK